jgi:hypothetical protein
MKQVYVISYCIKTENSSAFFHFNGVYCGNLIKKIRVEDCNKFEINGVYLLDLVVVELRGNLLVAKLNKYREINFLF